jgi:hypothetical protein
MHPPSALPIVKAVEKIVDTYHAHYPDLAKFSMTKNSPSLNTVDVFRALLDHAIAPTSVALEFWNVLQAYFNGALVQYGDATDPQSVALSPRDGKWTTVDDGLITMSEMALNELTEGMNKHAREWMTMLLLPSMFLTPYLCEAEMTVRPQSVPAGRPQRQ